MLATVVFAGTMLAPRAPAQVSLPAIVTRRLSGVPFAVAVSPQNVVYVTLTHAGLAVRADLPSMDLSDPFPIGPLPSQLRIGPDGRTAYVSNQDARTLTFIDVASNRAFARVPVPGGSVLTLGVSPDGEHLYALTDYAGVHEFTTNPPRYAATIPRASTGHILTGVAFHPDGRCMYVASRDAGAVYTIDLGRRVVVRADTVRGARIQNVAVSPDGRTLFATDIQRSMLLVHDLADDDAAISEYAIGSGTVRNAFDVAVSPDNQFAYVTTLADGNVYVLDRHTRDPVVTLPRGGSPRYIAFTQDARLAIITNEAGWVDFIATDAVRPARDRDTLNVSADPDCPSPRARRASRSQP